VTAEEEICTIRQCLVNPLGDVRAALIDVDNFGWPGRRVRVGAIGASHLNVSRE